MRERKIIKLTLLFLGIVVLSISCGKDDETTLEGEVEMTFPSDWKVTQNYSDFVVLLGISPKEDANDDFLENVNVVKEKAKGYSLESYHEASLRNLKLFTNYQLVSTEDTTINGFDTKKTIFTATLNDNELKFMDYIFHEENFGYVITCTALENTFEANKATFESIVSTFKIY
jgi:hypothetical protein